MDPFLPFYPLKNQNFEKMKKIATYFINVHQKSWSSIIWWMVPVVQSEMDSMFCHFVLFFSLLPPQQPWKSKSWKKKQHLHMSSFYTRAPKITIIRCMLPEMWHAIDFVPFFALLFLWQPGKTYFWKIEKNTWRYDHFTHVYHK